MRRRILSNIGPQHTKVIHNLLLRTIAENERLRASVWQLDRKVAKIALRLVDIISEEHRLLIENVLIGMYGKLRDVQTKIFQFLTARKPVVFDASKRGHEVDFSHENKICSSTFFVRTLSNSELQDQLTHLGLPSNGAIFGFVGELREKNRPLGFLRLAYWMQIFKDDSFFVMIGDGPLRDEVPAIAAKYKLSNFRWIPFLERPEQLYAVLMGLVITSAFEEQGPAVMFEAQPVEFPFSQRMLEKLNDCSSSMGTALLLLMTPKRRILRTVSNCGRII